MIDGGRYDRALNSDIFKKLQSQSVFFSQSITYGPHTIAAMHAVFSGSYGSRTGTNSYWSTFKFKKEKFKTITEYLHDDGYYTHADVINKLVVPKQGFDNYIVHDEKNDNLTLRHIDLLNQMKSINDTGKSFFLYLHYSNIHTGIMDQVLKIYDNFSSEFFENKEANEKRYDLLFHDAELYLKNQLDEIEKLGFLKNSIILVMSDHGVSVGEKIGERAYGAFCYDYTLHSFTYFLFEDILPKTISQQIRTVDFMPTVLDYLDVQLDENFEKLNGKSLLPLIKNNESFETFAYSETGNPLKNKEPPKEPNTFSVRTSTWKLIFNEYDETKELYNLINDHDELKNLIDTEIPEQSILWKKLIEFKNGTEI